MVKICIIPSKLKKSAKYIPPWETRYRESHLFFDGVQNIFIFRLSERLSAHETISIEFAISHTNKTKKHKSQIPTLFPHLIELAVVQYERVWNV